MVTTAVRQAVSKLRMGKINYLLAQTSHSHNFQMQIMNQISVVGIQILEREVQNALLSSTKNKQNLLQNLLPSKEPSLALFALSEDDLPILHQ